MPLFRARGRALEVHPGDRFVKSADPHGKMWEVVELGVAVDGIMHARMTSVDGRQAITIAAEVLLDPAFWLRKLPDL